MDMPDSLFLEFSVGLAVLAEDGRPGIVRYLFDSPQGQVAVVKFDTELLSVIPVDRLRVLAPELHSADQLSEQK